MQNAVNESLRNMMETLKEQKIADHLSTSSIHRYSILFKNGIDANDHSNYLTEFADDFYNKMKHLIDSSLKERSVYTDDENYNEVLQHLDTCVRIVRHFQGRVELIEKIRNYIESDSNGKLRYYDCMRQFPQSYNFLCDRCLES